MIQELSVRMNEGLRCALSTSNSDTMLDELLGEATTSGGCDEYSISSSTSNRSVHCALSAFSNEGSYNPLPHEGCTAADTPIDGSGVVEGFSCDVSLKFDDCDDFLGSSSSTSSSSPHDTSTPFNDAPSDLLLDLMR